MRAADDLPRYRSAERPADLNMLAQPAETATAPTRFALTLH